ncbi:MAG: response regulator [Planctomycetota bacterium]|jgi:CheY-like chemotaxis protein
MTIESATARILCFSRDVDQAREFGARFQNDYDVVCPESIEDSLDSLQSGGFAGLFLCGCDMSAAGLLLQAGGILENLHDGFALVGLNRELLWHNVRFHELAGDGESFIGRDFYACFGAPEILGPDFCPLNTAIGMGESARSTLRIGDKTYYEVEATPVFDPKSEYQGIARFLIVVLRDTSSQVLQKQKLNAIYQAGLELGDLTPQELLEMSVDDRVELLKSKILHFTQDLLEYDTVEIRLLNRKTQQLDPLLAVGMEIDAETRPLKASPKDNGVTGFVAATGKSYLCEDTSTDPLYLVGAAEARSSLTVPLTLHDEIFGTFNVESPRTGAFSENDLQFLELFAREIAVALNTLDLLAVEQSSSASRKTEAILREVAEPVDEIIQDSTWLLENAVGSNPQIMDRLRDVLKRTREIRQLIQHAGGNTETSHPELIDSGTNPLLRNKRILVVDSDDEVRRCAHEQLGRLGCDVETAHNAEECFLLARSFHYDAVIADIRLPDRKGYEVFEQLKQIDPHLAVMLMTGYGYDPGHSIVKARQAGCESFLFKPFRTEQVVKTLEAAFQPPTETEQNGDTAAE